MISLSRFWSSKKLCPQYFSFWNMIDHESRQAVVAFLRRVSKDVAMRIPPTGGKPRTNSWASYCGPHLNLEWTMTNLILQPPLASHCLSARHTARECPWPECT